MFSKHGSHIPFHALFAAYSQVTKARLFRPSRILFSGNNISHDLVTLNTKPSHPENVSHIPAFHTNYATCLKAGFQGRISRHTQQKRAQLWGNPLVCCLNLRSCASENSPQPTPTLSSESIVSCLKPGGVSFGKVGWGYAAHFPKFLPYIRSKSRAFVHGVIDQY